MNEYIKIYSDDWADAGRIYKVLEYYRRGADTSAAEILIEHEGGQRERRVVPYHQIEWIPDGEQ